MTIEGQLERYAYSENKTNRHKLLWHAWNHNKEWLSQLLEWVMPSYQSYSKHDVSHAVAVLHNIEMILGENGIKQLSASNCFLILHVVYIHDIGMCITNDYRENLMHDPDFINFLQQKRHDRNFAEYADILLTECEKLFEEKSHDIYESVVLEQTKLYGYESEDGQRMVVCLEKKLKVHYAIICMTAEYRRVSHGIESQNTLTEWIKQPDKLGVGFSTSGIPIRFFYTIGACASAHTQYDFQAILDLPKADGGYTQDFMHPRFAAVLLQLGDALDLDNDRFHPLVKEFVGKLPAASELHYGKHKSIRRLLISPTKIKLEADCETAEELRLVRQEYDGIKDILKNATYHWSAIRPLDTDIVLPELEDMVLFLQGHPISESLVNVRFDIQQDKAFSLLQGDNIYKRERYVFLREIFQNAIDASKREYWQDWKGSCWYDENEMHCEKYLSPDAYPIEVEFHLAVKGKYEKEYHLLDTVQKTTQLNPFLGAIKEKEYGVVVRVRDYGPGISSRDIMAIADVGSSYERYGKMCKEMPRWLQPTAQFGIGLQSVFLVADTFTAETHIRGGAGYKIEFCTASVKKGGEINVTPLDQNSDAASGKKYGTVFEVFVSNAKKREPLEDILSWSGLDPFEHENRGIYERDINQSRELMAQLIFYLDDAIGEKIFPVDVKVFEINNNGFTQRILSKKKDMQLEFNVIAPGDKGKSMYMFPGKSEFDSRVTWTYAIWKKQVAHPDDYKWAFEKKENPQKCKCRGMVDVDQGRLYIASTDNELYACFSAERIMRMRQKRHKSESGHLIEPTKIYYKGIYVTEINFEEDMDMLEFIDLKGKLEREHLAVNRSAFTADGEQFIRKEIYPKVLSYAYKIIGELGELGFARELCKIPESNEVFKRLILYGNYVKYDSDELTIIQPKNEEIADIAIRHKPKFDKHRDNVSDNEVIHRRILFLTALPTFWRTFNCISYILPALPNKNTASNDAWNKVLEQLGTFIQDQNYATSDKESVLWSESSFYNLRCSLSGAAGTSDAWPTQSLPQIMSTNNHYAIISARRASNSLWDEYLVQLDDDEAKKIKEAVMQLRTESDPERKREQEQFIEEWPIKIFKEYKTLRDRNSLDTVPIAKRMNQHSIIIWMLKNLPSLAVFADQDNNVRINILDAEHTDSIYLGMHMKQAIYERMAEYYKEKGIQRFSTVTNTGYCQLGLDKRHSSVYFLKRGCFGKVGRWHMLVPLDGPSIAYLAERIADDGIPWTICLLESIEKFCKQVAAKWRKRKLNDNVELTEGKEWMRPIFERYKNVIGENDIDVATLTSDISSELNMKLKSLESQPEFPENDFPEISQNMGEQVCIYLLTGIGNEETITLIDSYVLPGWGLLRNGINDAGDSTGSSQEESNLEKKKVLVKKYFAYYEIHGKYIEPYHISIDDETALQKKLLDKKRSLLKYVAENSWVRRLSESDIELLYGNYINDMVSCMWESTRARLENLRKYFNF